MTNNIVLSRFGNHSRAARSNEQRDIDWMEPNTSVAAKPKQDPTSYKSRIWSGTLWQYQTESALLTHA
jgi:hypothetical protein